jgi:L-malate glycosyltransferase
MQKKKSIIRVLFYEPYPMGLGGNFLTQRLILERLDRNLFLPIVVSPLEGIALDEFRKMGVECVIIPPQGSLGSYGRTILKGGILGKLKTVVELFQYNLKLTKFIRQRKIDVVYNNCVRAQIKIGLASRLTGVPSLLYIKGTLIHQVIDCLSFILAKKILFFCSQNRDDKYPGLVRFFNQKIDILKIGLDLSVINDVLKRDKTSIINELGINLSLKNVAVIGQLYKPKGQHFAVQALSSLVNEFPEIRLYLLGDSVIDEYIPYKKELEDLIQKYGLANNVIFTGWRRDALDIVSLMDIVIHPSLAEGFGRAVLEAMALGKPVIASKVGGLREAIKDRRNGFLVDIGDVEAIAQHWRELISDPELCLKMGQEARKTVYAEYQIDDKVVRLAEIWAEMARSKRAAVK